MEQVLVNLAVNARDAMPEGGSIVITTDLAVIDRNFIDVRGYGRTGEFAHIAVADSGAGIDRMTQQRIFEPFYTTKEVGKGTGLGLSIAYGIVEQHHGFIECQSEPNRGTVFHLHFPAVQGEAGVRNREVERQTPRGSETVLLIEDEEPVRRVTGMLLESLGYRVLPVSDGSEAVRLFREQHQSIDVALLDVIMPGMNGAQVLLELQRIRPDIKSIFMSGHTADVITGKGLLKEPVQLILKPVSLQELAARMRQTLDCDGQGVTAPL